MSLSLSTAPALVNTRDLDRNAYNAAFYELGLGWHWDAGTFEQMQSVDCGTERIRRYLATHQSHLLHAYDASFLAQAIETTKARCAELMLACGGAVAGEADWAALHSRQIGV